ncbi:hypothetical protein EDB83DRAFT_226114 [Lactarius deliciosus]|nr:hypothetical protein EDB83DRAFT_226114 [Lactarius deliciosus]
MSRKGKAGMVAELMERDGGGISMVCVGSPSAMGANGTKMQVGDGINDSPVLSVATVGIALSSGTSVAIEAADIVPTRLDLLDTVVDLSRAIFSTTRRNLVWACVYNVLGIALAMGLFLPFGLHQYPIMVGAVMAFSPVSVVTRPLSVAQKVGPPATERHARCGRRAAVNVPFAALGDVCDEVCDAAREDAAHCHGRSWRQCSGEHGV